MCYIELSYVIIKVFLCQYVLHTVNLIKKRKISNRTKFRHWKSCMKKARTALNKQQPRNIKKKVILYAKHDGD